jgi:hypothetical protein
MNFQLMKLYYKVPIVFNFRPPATLKPFFSTLNYSGYLVATETLNPDLNSVLY